jgi:uncharacterized protein YegL
MSNLVIYDQELADNPTARVPICLVLDVSGSMAGGPINELNKGIEAFMTEILEDDIAQDAADISVVTFGTVVEIALKFDNIEKQVVPKFSAGGTTPMGAAVLKSLEILEERKKEYKEAGVDYFQPWLVLMTDGVPTDMQIIPSATKKTNNLINEKKLTLYSIGVGNNADMRQLSQFDLSKPPLKLDGLKFKEFFEWLSQSVSVVSNSTPGDGTLKMDLNDLRGWTTLEL